MPACVIEHSNIHGGISVTCYAPGWNVDQGALKNRSDKNEYFGMQIFLLEVWRKKECLKAFMLQGAGAWEGLLVGVSVRMHGSGI